VKRDVFLLKKKLIITLAALLIFISAVPAFATTSQGKQLMFQSPFVMQMAQKNGMGNMAEMMKDPNHMKDGNQMNGMMGSMGGMMGSGSKE
jgi:hypothetical protein